MEPLSKLISLLKKTGDKAIILDQSGEPSYVMMGFAEYERLIATQSGVTGLTEEELIDKINRDIAIWQDENQREPQSISDIDPSALVWDESEEDEAFMMNQGWSSVGDILAHEEAYNEDQDRYYFEPVE